MIALLTGLLVKIHENQVVLQVAGVGYEVEVTSGALAMLPVAGSGDPITLYTHLVVREDAQLLYGFASRNERELFRALIRVNSIGPKLALSVLSAMSLSELARAVAGKDIAALTKISGVGRKTAERLLMELKDKMDTLAKVLPAGDAQPSLEEVPAVAGEAQSEALAALVGLGYRAQEVAQVLDSVCASAAGADALANSSTEELIRLALRYFYRQSEAS